MDEIPGRIPNVNSIAPNKEMHELLHQQVLKSTLIVLLWVFLFVCLCVWVFLNKFFEAATETCDFLIANLHLLFLSRTTYTLCCASNLSSAVYKSGNSLKPLQINICCYWSILFSSLFSPIHPQCECMEKNNIFQLCYGFIYL